MRVLITLPLRSLDVINAPSICDIQLPLATQRWLRGHSLVGYSLDSKDNDGPEAYPIAKYAASSQGWAFAVDVAILH